jgi:hypothetical protein
MPEQVEFDFDYRDFPEPIPYQSKVLIKDGDNSALYYGKTAIVLLKKPAKFCGLKYWWYLVRIEGTKQGQYDPAGEEVWFPQFVLEKING